MKIRPHRASFDKNHRSKSSIRRRRQKRSRNRNKKDRFKNENATRQLTQLSDRLQKLKNNEDEQQTCLWFVKKMKRMKPSFMVNTPNADWLGGRKRRKEIRATQIWEWLYRKCQSFEEMTFLRPCEVKWSIHSTSSNGSCKSQQMERSSNIFWIARQHIWVKTNNVRQHYGLSV